MKSLFLLSFALLGAPLAGQKPVDVAKPGRMAEDAVLVDRPGDGKVWARARSYKASFDGGSATYIPFLGSDAPRNYPVGFALRGVRVGGADVDFEASGEVTTAGRRVSIDRGALVETYDLDQKGMEQSFIFKTLPASGDLVVRIGVMTELAASLASDGLCFANDLGAVRYGAAFVVDAQGKRAAMSTTFDDGTIALRAPAAFLASAAFPVTVDPIVTTFAARGSTVTEFGSDLAYDASTSQYLIVWEEAFSATDHDVGSVRQDRDGNQVFASLAWIDNTSTSWGHARVANLRAPHRFLVVGERGAFPNRQIWGRTREAGSALMSPQFEISANGGSGDKLNPDVGGNGNASGPMYWSVVWERTYSATDSDVHAQLIDELGGRHGGVILLANTGGTQDTHPAISKSNGGAPSTTQDWTVVWQFRRTPAANEIHFARIHWDGALTQPAIFLQGDLADFTNPVVSSPTDEINGRRYWMACFQAELSATNHDIVGVVCAGSQMVMWHNVSLLESQGNEAKDQVMPSVDTDGCRFVVAWAEQYALQSSDYDVLGSTYHVSDGGRFGVTESRILLGSSNNAELWPRVCATHSGGALDHRYGITWEQEYAPSDWDIKGAVYEGLGVGGVTTLPTGCGGLGMSTSGGTILGDTASFQMTGVGANAPVMILSLPAPPVTVCGGCGLGVKLTTATFFGGSSLTLPIPCNGAFVGGTVAVQGLTVGTGPCVSGLVTMSDTALLRVR